MRRACAVVVLSVLALAACGKKEEAKAPSAPGEQGRPGERAKPGVPTDLASLHRKPGLWRQSVTSRGTTQSMRLCTDATTEAKLSLWGGQATKDMCSKQEIKRGLAGDITFSSVCNIGAGGTMTTTGVMKGDFNSKYFVTSKSITEGAAAPQMNGEHEMTMEAVWEGPCPPDFRPGDMELSRGVKFNIIEMGASEAAGQ